MIFRLYSFLSVEAIGRDVDASALLFGSGFSLWRVRVKRVLLCLETITTSFPLSTIRRSLKKAIFVLSFDDNLFSPFYQFQQFKKILSRFCCGYCHIALSVSYCCGYICMMECLQHFPILATRSKKHAILFLC